MRPVLLGLLLIVASLAPQPAKAATATPGQYYLALGDSLAFGVTSTGTADPSCISGAQGYVCLVYRVLRLLNPSTRLVNLSQPGLDSCEVLHGYGGSSPCTRQLSRPVASPLKAALALIHSHPGEVSPITIDVGANDLFPLLAGAESNPLSLLSQVPHAIATYQANLGALLSALRTADPGAVIVVCTYYNPVSGLHTSTLPSAIQDVIASAVNGLNTAIRLEAAKEHAVVAESGQRLDSAPGGAASLTGIAAVAGSGNLSDLSNAIHPTPQGYALYGEAVVSALPYPFPLAIHVPSTVSVRETIAVTVETAPDSPIRVRLALPGHAVRHAKVVTGAGGATSFTLKAGSRTGIAKLRVCVRTYAGSRRCMRRALTITAGTP